MNDRWNERLLAAAVLTVLALSAARMFGWW